MKENNINALETTISNKEKEIAHKQKAITEISENSFAAIYKYKRDRRNSVTAELNEYGNHKRKWVQDVEISFTVDEKIAPAGRTKTYLTLYNADTGLPVKPHENKLIEIENYRAFYILKLEKNELEKGKYYFLVTHEEKTIFKQKFKIKGNV